jgi:hypothetical protein
LERSITVMRLLIWLRLLDRLICLGRRSNVYYIRFYPNPGFMAPWFHGKRIRWSKFYGWSVTKAPIEGNPKGV